MMITVTIEDSRDFIERHSKDGPPIRTADVLRFPDGAMLNDYERQFPPPTDPAELLKARQRYWSLRLRECESDFHTLKAVLTGHEGTFTWPAKRYGPSSGDGPTDLRILQAAVKLARETLAGIEADIAELPEVIQRRAAERAHEAAAQAARDQAFRVAQQVQAITIDE